MGSKTIAAIVGVGLVILGVVLFFFHNRLSSKIKDKKKELEPFEHPLNEAPSLWVGNQVMGTVMFGAFERESAPIGAYAMYRFFMLLWLPILPMGCYLAKESVGQRGRMSYRIYCELQLDGEELLDIYLSRWGIGFIISGLVVMIANLG